MSKITTRGRVPNLDIGGEQLQNLRCSHITGHFGEWGDEIDVTCHRMDASNMTNMLLDSGLESSKMGV
jgi:hypothetical protein